jgi:lactate dehydrogenase-like 2-hydroxyacid dehydrogenase
VLISNFSSLLPTSCKISASAGAGFDWVDTTRLASRGILYCNAAAACTEAVADAAIWLILSTFRLFSWSATAARSASPAQFTDAHKNIAAVTHNPRGSSLGIIGLGKIGYMIAQKASTALGMKILYNDVVRMGAAIERSVSATYFEHLEDMLAVADCVVVATPFGGTKVLNADNIAKMKHGSRIVNIARGKLIDEEALVSALENGQLFAAGLDVHYDEPNVNPKLARMKNVELLSHTAGAAVESHVGFERLGMENILSFLESGKAITAVNAHLINKSRL